MRWTCAIQRAIFLLNCNVSIVQLLAITEQRCNDDFILNLLEIMPYFWSF